MFENFVWNCVINHVLTLPVHQDYKISKMFSLKLPSYALWRIGLTNNEILDNYCIALQDGRSIHIKIYKDHYLAHWDQCDPNLDPLGHLWHDAKKELFVGLLVADQILTGGKARKWTIKKGKEILGL